MAQQPVRSGTGICDECGEECEFYMEDVGIGSYEYWGAPGVDVQWVEISCCCDADVSNPEYDVPDPPDYPEDDWREMR